MPAPGEIRLDAAANDEGIVLHNGALSLRLPADGYCDGDSPGPVLDGSSMAGCAVVSAVFEGCLAREAPEVNL